MTDYLKTLYDSLFSMLFTWKKYPTGLYLLKDSIGKYSPYPGLSPCISQVSNDSSVKCPNDGYQQAVLMHNELNLKRIFTSLMLVCWISPAHASLTGIPGYSLYETGSSSCHACHTQPSSAPANTLTITGNTTVTTGSTNSYTLTLVAPYTQDVSHGGFNLSTTDGVLSAANGETQVSNSELHHSNRKLTTDTGSSYDVSWLFNWQAPAVAGTTTFYACGLPVNGDGQATESSGGHGPGPGGPPGSSSTDGWTTCTSISIQVQQAPIANAGTNQTVTEGTTGVTLDGSASTDDGSITFQWQQLSGSSVSLTNANTAIASFDAPAVTATTELVFQLTVTDNDNNVSSDTVSVFVQDTADPNTPPVADAGTDQNPNENTLVNLDGTGSSDAEDTVPSSYFWQQTAGNTIVTLDNDSIASPSFTSPMVSATGDTLTFKLTVTDSQGLQATDSVNIIVNDTDNPPVAKISDLTGTVITAIANNAEVTLFGNFSNDPDGAITAYSWSQTAGPAIINPGSSNTNQFTFTTPDSQGSTIDIQLTVTGDEGSVQDSITSTLTLAYLPPAVNAGFDQQYLEGETVYFHGSVTDPNNDIASIQWQHINCAPSCLSLPVDNQPSISFALPSISAAESGMTMDFELSVIDSQGLTASDIISITIIDNGITTYPDTSISFYSNNNQPMALDISSPDASNDAELSILQPLSPDSITDTENRPTSFPYELLDFEVAISTPGSAVEIALFFPESIPENFDYYQYINTSGWLNNSDSRDFDNLTFTTGGWSETSEQVTFNADRTQVTIYVTDGGPGDADGLANGSIRYLSGIGENPATSRKQAGATGSTNLAVLMLLVFIQLRLRRH